MFMHILKTCLFSKVNVINLSSVRQTRQNHFLISRNQTFWLTQNFLICQNQSTIRLLSIVRFSIKTHCLWSQLCIQSTWIIPGSKMCTVFPNRQVCAQGGIPFKHSNIQLKILWEISKLSMLMICGWLFMNVCQVPKNITLIIWECFAVSSTRHFSKLEKSGWCGTIYFLSLMYMGWSMGTRDTLLFC